VKLVKWAFGAARDSAKSRRVVLHVTPCEERFVPDGALPAPPAGGWDPGPVAAPTQAETVTVQPGQWLFVGQVAGADQWFTLDTHGRQWLFSGDPVSGTYTAALLNYDGSYDPTQNPLAQANFVPDPANANLAWNPDQGTWQTLAPSTAFTGGVSGFASGGWNIVFLTRMLPPPPVNPPTQPANGAPVTIGPGSTITIFGATFLIQQAPYFGATDVEPPGIILVPLAPAPAPHVVNVTPPPNWGPLPPIWWAGSSNPWVPPYIGPTDN
jgi:hypothetical protein